MLKLEELEDRITPSSVWIENQGFLDKYENGIHIVRLEPFPQFRGNLNFDVDKNSIVVGAGAGGGPHVKRFKIEGKSLIETTSFFAYDSSLTSGVYVEGNDREIITGPQKGGGPHVKEFTSEGKLIREYFVGDPLSLNGVQVSLQDEDLPVISIPDTRPQAETTIYLDFRSISDPQRISNIFSLVADRYSLYNVNITLNPLNRPISNVAHVIIANTPIEGTGEEALGAAIVNGFFQQSSFTLHPAIVWSSNLNDTQIARVILHESAHLFGLEHSTNSSSIMFPNIVPGLGIFDSFDDIILSLRLGKIK